MMKGKVAIVTGGTSGMGFATAKLLSEKGCKVIITGCEPETTVEKAAAKIEKDVLGIKCDMANCEELEQMCKMVLKKYRKIDILVNNAGISGDIGEIDKVTTMDNVRKSFDVNVQGLLWLTKLVAKEMKKRKSGSIVNLSSCVAVRGYNGFSVYSATKGAVRSFTLALARELAPLNIRVNMISPGVIRTHFHDHMGGGTYKGGIKFQNAALQAIPLGRIGRPEEAATVIAFLADNSLSGYVTGADIPIDGGLVI